MNSSKLLGSGVDPPASVWNCAENAVVIVSPAKTSASNCWNVMFVNGWVKAPVIGMVSPVLLSTSVPRILKEAEEDVGDVFCKLYGDSSGKAGVHTCPVAGIGSVHSAAPSIPENRNVNVM